MKFGNDLLFNTWVADRSWKRIQAQEPQAIKIIRNNLNQFEPGCGMIKLS